MQKVEESDILNQQNSNSSKSQQELKKAEKQVTSLTSQIEKLQQDIDKQKTQKSNLQAQIAQKDKQIEEFKKETQT